MNSFDQHPEERSQIRVEHGNRHTKTYMLKTTI